MRSNFHKQFRLTADKCGPPTCTTILCLSAKTPNSRCNTLANNMCHCKAQGGKADRMRNKTMAL